MHDAVKSWDMFNLECHGERLKKNAPSKTQVQSLVEVLFYCMDDLDDAVQN